jgi:hypothetical protein
MHALAMNGVAPPTPISDETYFGMCSVLTTPPWSDGQRPEGVRSLGSFPVTYALWVLRAGFVST